MNYICIRKVGCQDALSESFTIVEDEPVKLHIKYDNRVVFAHQGKLYHINAKDFFENFNPLWKGVINQEGGG